MEAFGKRMRGSLAALLSAALITSGALLAAPAAYAEEPVAEAPVAEVVEAPVAEAPAEEAPVEEPAPAPVSAETPQEAPAAAPQEEAPLRSLQLAVSAAPAVVSTEAPRAGGEITVTGSGFNPAYPGVYVGLGPAGLPGFYMGASSLTDTVHVGPENEEGTSSSGRTAKLNADGTFSLKLTVPAFAEGASYSIYVSKAHGQGMGDKSQDVIADVAYQVPVVATPAVTSTEAPRAGGEITVTGSGFNPAYPGVYVGLGPAGLPGFYMGASSLTDTVHVGPENEEGTSSSGRTAKLNADGTFSLKLTVPAFAEGASYSIYVSKAHGQGMGDKSQDVIKAVTFKAPVAVPSVEVVGSVTDLDPAASNVVTVKGSGFVPHAPDTSGTRPPLSGKFTGVYVAFGSYASAWQPSTGAAASTRSGVDVKWAVPAESMGTIGGPEAGAIELQADGTFETTLTLTPDESKALVDGSWGITTYPGGGAKYAPFETFKAVTFKAPVAVPSVEVVGSVTDLDPAASNVVTVKGSGFVPHAPDTSGTRPPLSGKFTGVYVAFGSYASAWQPSTGAAASTRSGVDVKWAVPAESMGTIGGPEAGAIELQADGTFETTLTLTPDESKALVDGSWGITTYPGGGAKYAPFETFKAVTFKAPGGATVRATPSVTKDGLKVDVQATGLPGSIYAALIERGTAAHLDMGDTGSYAAFASNPFPTVTDGASSFTLTAPASKLDRKKVYEVLVWKIHSMPTAANVYGQGNVDVTTAQWDELEGIVPPVVVPPKPIVPGAGSLTWGISSGFVTYVTGGIAKGSIATNGVGGGRGGYVFPQAVGSVWNAETRTGTVYYSGSVTFIGHGGLLHETFSNPVITVTSPISGTISSNGQSFPLNLAGAGFTANADGSVTWSNVAVSGVISGGDGAGSGGSLTMDPLSFTVGSASGLNFGSTTTTSKFAQARTPAATPPATTGLQVVTPTAKLVAGGEIEITASGFEPNEQGILVVIYSEPTVLDTNAKADKDGVVRWIGKLPKNLTGKHTITLQGSISVGQEITIASADAVKAKAKPAVSSTATQGAAQNAGPLPDSGTPVWVWWAGALALLVIAGASTGLVVAQRRKNEAPTHL